MQSELGLDPSNVGYRSGLVDGKSKFAYVRQTYVYFFAFFHYFGDLKLIICFCRRVSHSLTPSPTLHGATVVSLPMAPLLSTPVSFVRPPIIVTNSFVSPFSSAKSKIAASNPTLTVTSVLPSVESALGGTFNNHTPSVEYLAREDGSVSLVHVVQIRNEDEGTWFEAYACAHTGKLLSVTDFVAHASVSNELRPHNRNKIKKLIGDFVLVRCSPDFKTSL
jgi:hypothetical protein